MVFLKKEIYPIIYLYFLYLLNHETNKENDANIYMISCLEPSEIGKNMDDNKNANIKASYRFFLKNASLVILFSIKKITRELINRMKL